jgi:UDP-N-acetylglucosamine diphosphorylase / glucose-1-phosphate thymidylyltransferase / UDP-N-acetylgalactosamine diphosphorylase / glucosamine-1-phosphate N-acetyltransferase / galactosamine-1-phosphate N-acetyltransferase
LLKPGDYFDLSQPSVAQIFEGVEYVWEVVIRLPEIVAALVSNQRIIQSEIGVGSIIGDGPIFIGHEAVIEPGVYIMPPAYIGPHSIVRHGAYVRPNSIILEHAVLGHASEIKSSLMLPHAQAPHFAYVGDSILGHHVNLGAGTKLSNFAITGGHVRGVEQKSNIVVRADSEEYDTGTRKLGAILGDEVQTGCNSVLNPGCLVGPRTMIYPNAVLAKGFYPADSIIKLRQKFEITERAF